MCAQRDPRNPEEDPAAEDDQQTVPTVDPEVTPDLDVRESVPVDNAVEQDELTPADER